MKRFLVIVLFIICIQAFPQKLPTGFTYLSSIDTSIQTELRYYTNDNFVGKPIDGYLKDTCIMSLASALALKKVQNKLKSFGLSLKVYDAYRPQRAVNHFVKWASNLGDTLQKHRYYPDVDKKDLFKLDYIASRSGHTRGSAVDLTIIDGKTGIELDMGSSWDFFGQASHPDFTELSKEQRANRLLLRTLMLEAGFQPYEQEWWHFSLKEEPFPKTYFDFPIE